jgi:hypothetical protein
VSLSSVATHQVKPAAIDDNEIKRIKRLEKMNNDVVALIDKNNWMI